MAFPPAIDFSRLIASLSQALKERDLAFMLIGGQAVLLHGEPRLTQDVDVTLAGSPDLLPEVLEVCAAVGLTPLPDNITKFVRETFVLPTADPGSGIRVDLIFSTTPYEAEAIRRAVVIDVGGAPVPFASAEDLILHKLFAGRPRDLEDVAGVVRRKGHQLDWTYIEHWAGEFSVLPGRENLSEMARALKQQVHS